MDREQRVCPACGQPVQSVVQRYKTLGAWVPRWVPGPCHNPKCEAYVEPGARPDASRPDASRPDAAEPDQEPGAPTART
ncbi:hypothetical protein [Streptomyces sp. NBC_01235]|uniref:hypothetical protein n=1 Tax=Streptomyces sp. NBC_01235 TaxID=2903788 RepID=UPI002E155A6F|nr:hypothetical protein OG289_33455 [Streptomyces sp. NBC_01235]